MKKIMMTLVILAALIASFTGAHASKQQAEGEYKVAGMPRGA
ncbi:lysogeny pheromone AimP family peptide [Bacillus atrophaeus]|nr:lysogeny pheromone AimP family peptide [Bacillus atrophaeus]MCY8810647.1 lysogeny pheromone AimP family peptide [Bacillus atrophaeus]MCY8907800.1 lysogeny pheromone AimP family peptide [Bacillus atrophaeus]MEC0837805.1 lysogeny pheromone AimP family peptide [Bacillus atrophaeus]MEC0847706.1 lysogeny pheromone AimP family peptide [Bacillus atrophaeus]MEC0849926.1 lysogeny pheromone AimP family peptide [Bacillus atrophaeus]